MNFAVFPSKNTLFLPFFQGFLSNFCRFSKISALSGVNIGIDNRRFSVVIEETRALIQGKAALGQSYCLLYPYDERAKYESDVISTLLPDTQRPQKDGFDANANILATVTEDHSVTMSNVCGLLRFSIEGDDVESVSLTSVGGENFVGTIKVNMTDPARPNVISAGKGQ